MIRFSFGKPVIQAAFLLAVCQFSGMNVIIAGNSTHNASSSKQPFWLDIYAFSIFNQMKFLICRFFNVLILQYLFETSCMCRAWLIQLDESQFAHCNLL